MLCCICWNDFVKETLTYDEIWPETMWFNSLDTIYIPHASHTARPADPHAKLHINEYNITGTAAGPKATSMQIFIDELKRAGVPA
ncbi:hypothetical protein C8Q77DRAFT_1162460 [Trametes polyzona]|nr:hypothetical protein C8Q77DRAFT_1162460 [Trametes polyzona]